MDVVCNGSGYRKYSELAKQIDVLCVSLGSSTVELHDSPRLNGNVEMGCKRRNVSSGILNSSRTKGQQWWTYCLRTAKKVYLKSAPELLRLEEKHICARRLLLHNQNSYTYFKKRNRSIYNCIILELREIFRNYGMIATIESVVYNNVLQRAEWALPRPFLHINEFFQNKKVYNRRACACSEAGFSSQSGDSAWVIYYPRAAFCCGVFCGQKDSMQRIFIKKCFLFTWEVFVA
jgi:hypothetical protein